MTVPFSIEDPDQPGQLALVLGVSHPYLLVGPIMKGDPMRWVRADEAKFGQVYYDQPWHAVFSRPPAELL